jgi:hypothetical protein
LFEFPGSPIEVIPTPLPSGTCIKGDAHSSGMGRLCRRANCRLEGKHASLSSLLISLLEKITTISDSFTPQNSRQTEISTRIFEQNECNFQKSVGELKQGSKRMDGSIHSVTTGRWCSSRASKSIPWEIAQD